MPIEVRRLHPMFVAEVGGIDLRQPMSDTTYAAVQAAIDRDAALVFRGDKLSEEQQVAFSQRFGPIAAQNGVLQTGIERRVSAQLVDISNLDEQNRILSRDDRRRMFALGNQLWHTDSSFKRIPAKYSLLHAHAVTPEGGETQVADLRAAYDALPEKMKARLEGLVAEHSIFTSRAKLGFTEFSAEERAALPPVHHPVVRVHPASKRRSLYLASHASHIVGWPVPDGRMLLHELIEHATQPQFVYTHTWQVGDLLMWDNRCTMHRGRPYDEANHRRDLRRATIDDTAASQEMVA
jgi:alpha-ketoglutarate-dependent 2,4-dichlorophenoxyacetate dioxygenase